MNCWRDESFQRRVGGFVAYSLRGLRGSVRKERLVALPTRWGWEVPRAPLSLHKIATLGLSYHLALVCFSQLICKSSPSVVNSLPIGFRLPS